MNWSKTNFVHNKCVIKLEGRGEGQDSNVVIIRGGNNFSRFFFVDDAMLFEGVNATQFRFFMKWEIIFFERFLFHL